MILVVFLGWLLAFPAMALPSKTDEDYKNFSKTCKNIGVDSSYVSAECLDISGLHSKNQTLDLDMCVGIDYTSLDLTWAIYGKMSGYCGHCQLDLDQPEGPILSCTCAWSGSKANSTLTLDDGIGNNNGTLSCNGGAGMPTIG
ncbi:hypothetical protein B0T14DRAFT_500191 [Immersiella caudata]|uniref:Cyanovirin-N domain-containing protein n=1 Tax=Immersiella caudata TaxID=314043 RepID=A0AA39U4W1_9PEZI|nr:hypothetical protein B0T14DRAFT_500191 [Immersiella caudata]